MPETDGLPRYPDDEDYDPLLDLSAAEGIPSRSEKAEKAKRKLAELDDADERKQPRSGKKKRLTLLDWARNDNGNAEFFLSEYGDDIRFDASIGEWVIWNASESRWEVDSPQAYRLAMTISEKFLAAAGDILRLDPDDDVGKSLRSWGNQAGNLSRIKSMLELSKQMPGVTVSGGEFNGNNRLLSCPNGMLVLEKTGVKFRPSSKSDMTTRVVGCKYEDGAKSPMFEDFLDKFLPEVELREWAQKVAGYSMIGGNPQRKIVFCWGPTSSGKSTFAELIRSALGQYAGPFNLSMLRESPDERPRPDLVAALTQRAIFAAEASSDWHLHADMIKRATGQDPILARLPHSGVGITKIPDFTPWIVTNNIPTIKGADQALYRRLCTVLFPHTISEQEEVDDFRAELIERGELPGVLQWLIDGWKLYCIEGLSNPPHAVVTAEMRMREQFSDLDIFLAECCDKGGSDYREIPSDLFSAYEDWAETNGIRGRDRLTNTSFGRLLSGRGFPAKLVKERETGKVVRRRIGLRLRPHKK